ncbi:MAG TPA: hypothetical protein VG738_06550 [Chitinophagaceae bacterium]|nr:hypothetical protein [Chitinophagaceae bacterium]
MILIADSGSTKTTWCLLNATGGHYFFNTEGYNPYFVTTSHIIQSLTANLPATITAASISEVWFYGAGCFEDKTGIVSRALAQVFINARNHVALDLLGSARAVLGNQPGFVAILGTGTNTCLYDGEKITANIDSVGYLLGDEGSGFYIGKKILSDYIREYMPLPVRQEFFATYNLTREAIMETVYSTKLPNRFCAGFTQFISTSTAGKAYFRSLVKNAFIDFFTNLVSGYKNHRQYTFNCTGSIGCAFKDILAETADAFGMKAGVIIKRPIEGLAMHHARLTQ